MNPFMLLAEASAFDASSSLEMAKTIITWILDVIKGEPIMAAAFVIGILVPAGFGIIRSVKGVSRR